MPSRRAADTRCSAPGTRPWRKLVGLVSGFGAASQRFNPPQSLLQEGFASVFRILQTLRLIDQTSINLLRRNRVRAALLLKGDVDH